MTGWFGDGFGSWTKGWLVRSRQAESGQSLKALARELPGSTLEDIGLTRAGTMLVQGHALEERMPGPLERLLMTKNRPVPSAAREPASHSVRTIREQRPIGSRSGAALSV